MLKNFLTTNEKLKDIGLLIIRLGIGASILTFHGYGKITAGPESWARIGSNIQHLGINFMPAFWGFMAGFAEFFCSLLIMLGILFRPAATLLAFTMLVASLRHLNLPPDTAGAGWSGASHAMELLTIYVGLFLAGPGKYRLTFRRQKQSGTKTSQ